MNGATVDLAIHPRTQVDLEQFKQQPGHSLLLLGPAGSGKLSLAQQLVTEITGKSPESNPYLLHIAPNGKSISIEAIRQAQQFVRLKTTGKQALRRAIIVEDAHLLTTEAQNAFLKLLEEPPADTIIVLTAIGRDSLLPTIASRTRLISVKALDQAVVQDAFTAQGYDATKVQKAFYMSGGRPGLVKRLLDDNEDDELLGYIDHAKKFLQAKPFDRLLLVDRLLKQKVELPRLLWALQTVAEAALQQSANKTGTTAVARWTHILEAILEAQDSLPAHPLPKLLLTNLSLQT